MRITGVEPVLLTGPSSNDPWINFAKTYRTVALVEITTDTGLTGVGETYAGYFAAELIAPVLDLVRDVLVHGETTDPRVLGPRMRTSLGYIARVGVAAAIISAVEAALWDLTGKAEGVPVHELLGGAVHDELPGYATGGPSPWPAEQLRRKLDDYLSQGFTGLKLASGWLDMDSREEKLVGRDQDEIVQVEVDKVAMIREHVGEDVEILLDGHMGGRSGNNGWTVEIALAVMTALAPYRIGFFEEPLPYTDPDSYAELTRRSPVPIAGGEQLSSYAEFAIWMNRDAFHIAQPDASWISMTEFRQVDELAQERGASIASHNWCGGAGVLQNVHAAFASPSTQILELLPSPGPLHTELWGENLQIRNGNVAKPEAPGLGVQLTDELRRRYPYVKGMEEFAPVPGKRLTS